jgi:5-methylcytosine-specific restriction endonuclease McrA
MPKIGYIMSNETKNKISNALIGKNTWSKGRKMSLETRIKMRISNKGKGRKNVLIGDKNPMWKGGRTNEETSWLKNKRNRVIKRLKIEGLTHTFGEWDLLKKQYGYTCPCCKKSEPEIKLTEDHIIPLSKGGSDLIENIQPLCRSCNCKKHTKIIKY